MIRFVVLLAMVLSALPAAAEDAPPFAMGPAAVHPDPAAGAGAPAPGSPGSGTADAAGPIFRIGPVVGGAEAIPGPAQPLAAAPIERPAAAAVPAGRRKLIVPVRSLRLEGEEDYAAWTVHLSASEALAPVALELGFINSVFVMPEASQLRVVVNDTVVVLRPLASSADEDRLSVPLPAGLLKAGANRIRMEVTQRHRTDCTVQSTFDLWTDIDPRATALVFPTLSAGGAMALDDLGAVGVDANGRATILIATPAGDRTEAAASVLAVAQAIALRLQQPNQVVRVVERLPAEIGPGVVPVLVGRSADLRGLADLPAPAPDRPYAGFVAGRSGQAVLLVTAPDWTGVAAAARRLEPAADAPGRRTEAADLGLLRTALGPVATEAARFSFADLGIATQEIAGRRFSTRFAIQVPADFYAAASGTGRIHLDAAYAPEVVPGGRFDVFVNGQAAASLPIGGSRDVVLRDFVIDVPLRAFRPGVNEIEIQIITETVEDRLCPPGAAANAASRFVLFDTSAFEMPSFARVARWPDLSALATTGYPYASRQDPLPVVLAATDDTTLSAAATLVARLARASDQVLPLVLDRRQAPGSALFVGTAAQFGSGVMTAFGLAETLRTGWQPVRAIAGLDRAARAPVSFPGGDAVAVAERWQEITRQSGAGGYVGWVADALEARLGISFADLRIQPPADLSYVPPAGSAAILAQAISPSGAGAWTMLTGPSPASLLAGAEALAGSSLWTGIDGRIVVWRIGADRVVTVPATDARLVPTAPLSLANLRLILANWVSENLLVFAAGLIAASLLCGLAASVVLDRSGRPS
ncbi:cellulose biosynthesis cyclic di-GMP-binding regulatory protein BcsB [Mongoliimonas terrestris]|uniref:cellulose biosynthesis cyclic di-GMP-binding regulatory protein BcsB n=1 Tax=Mongoliimonas terrestris TaxID=1709001 RepID=UPI000949A518|nr:cellulose biosynthesis cyclic di-GMP-binding regulatory protein BcsB [Mongoliimonas terrestris]